MEDKDTPNRAANKDKAEGERWGSDPSTVERRDRDRPESGAEASETDDVVNRTAAGIPTPRRYDQ